MQVVARGFGLTRVGLGGQEEAARLALEPRADAKLGVSIARRGIDVVDAMAEEDLEGTIGDLLGHARQRRRAENGAGAPVPGAPEVGDWDSHAPKRIPGAVFE